MNSDSAHYENINESILPPATHLQVENNLVNREAGLHVSHLGETSDTENEEPSLPLPVRSSPKRSKKKILLVVIPIVLLTVICAALVGVFIYKATTKNTNENTKETLTLDEGVYVGEILDGRAHGHGILTKSDGHRYEGEFINGMQDGQGILTGPRGSKSTGKIYEGTFLENKFDGQGTYYWPDGHRYQGVWRNNQRHGFGEIIYPDGRIQKGQWAYDQLSEEALVY